MVGGGAGAGCVSGGCRRGVALCCRGGVCWFDWGYAGSYFQRAEAFQTARRRDSCCPPVPPTAMGKMGRDEPAFSPSKGRVPACTVVESLPPTPAIVPRSTDPVTQGVVVAICIIQTPCFFALRLG